MRVITSLILSFTAAVLAAPLDGPVTYDGYKVFRINTEGDVKPIEEKLTSVSYEEWHRDAYSLDIALPADQVTAFNDLGLDFSVMHNDLGAAIAAESTLRTSVEFSSLSAGAPNLTWFNSYHPYLDHSRFLSDLQASFPDNSKIVSSGRSYQDRDLFGIHLYGSGGPGKPAVIWHGTVHAREWISAMVVEYLTVQLLNGYSSDETVKTILDRYDFHIFPFVNPDGFVYSQTTNRMWRKNRQPAQGSTCIGRDINRNWPAEWDSNPEGASPNPCAETFRGERPGDSPENKGLVDYAERVRDSSGIKLYIDWHAYGQYILSPWGYTCDIFPADNDEHIDLAMKTADAIRNSTGKAYTVGPACSTLYATTGDSTDYFHGPGRSDWTYTIELRDQGRSGFVLPPSQIKPSGEEQWVAMKTMLTSLD